MKKLVFFFSLLTAAMLITACSKSDTPAPGQDMPTFVISFTANNVQANSQFTQNQTTQLVNVMSSEYKDKASNVNKGEILNSGSFITITGLQTATSLASAKIDVIEGTGTQEKSVKSYLVNLSSIVSKGNDSTNDCTAFLTYMANYLATKKSITLRATLNNTGQTDVTGVVVNINISAIFSW